MPTKAVQADTVQTDTVQAGTVLTTNVPTGNLPTAEVSASLPGTGRPTQPAQYSIPA